MNDLNDSKCCPKCGARSLRSWSELGDDERQIIQRLSHPGDAEKQTSRWCLRCLHEERDDKPRLI